MRFVTREPDKAKLGNDTWQEFKGAAIDKNAAYSTRLSDLDVQSLAISSKLGKFGWSLGYYDFKNPVYDESAFKWTLVDTKYTFDTKWTLQAEYLHNGAEKIDSDAGTNAWAAKLTFGDFVLNKAGAQNFYAQYINVKANADWNDFAGLQTTPGGKLVNAVD